MKTAWIAGMLVAVASVAEAGPSARFGFTYGVAEPTLPNVNEVGPTLGVGNRFGPVLVELDYAYLSFLDDNTGEHGVQRLGGTVRIDLWRDANRRCVASLACTEATSIYGEAGVAERFGHWRLDSTTIAPLDGRQAEAHIGFGVELDNMARTGWQLGFRIVAAPRDPLDFACRSTNGCAAVMAPTSYDRSVLVDVSWLVGT